MKSQFVCQRCGVSVGRWAKGATTIWKHQANMHNTSCGKVPVVVERERYEREMRAFVEDAFAAINRPLIEEVKSRCPSCDGFGYHDEPGEPECEICEGNGMATRSAIRYYEREAK